MKRKFLITGGTGFIGSALVKALISNGENVRVLDNDSRGTKTRLDNIKGRFEFVKGDIRNPEIVKKACKDIDIVVHLAYINGTKFFYSKPDEVLEVGVKGMMNVLDGCLKHDVGELILASSSEVYQTPNIIPTPETVSMQVPDPLNPRYSYGGGKIISELLTINYGRKYFKRALIFRPHNVYGPDMGNEHVIPQFIIRMKDLINQSKGGLIKFPIQGNGFESRSFIYIDDFIKGLELIINLGKHLEIYHIGTQEQISVKSLAQKVGECFHRKIKVIQGELMLGSTPRRCPDITKLKKLGFKPEVNLKRGLKQTVEWYNTHN